MTTREPTPADDWSQFDRHSEHDGSCGGYPKCEFCAEAWQEASEDLAELRRIDLGSARSLRPVEERGATCGNDCGGCGACS